MHCLCLFQIHILINQTTGRLNYKADLIGVRLASINQILDPWVYILLRKSVIVKCFKTFKNFITSEFTGHSKTLKESTKYVTNYNKDNICRIGISTDEEGSGMDRSEAFCLDRGNSKSLSNGHSIRAEEADSLGRSVSSERLWYDSNSMHIFKYSFYVLYCPLYCIVHCSFVNMAYKLCETIVSLFYSLVWIKDKYEVKIRLWSY